MKSILKAAVAATALMLASPAAAEITYIDTFAGNDCEGGFPSCWAGQDGVVQGQPDDDTASPVVYKIGSGGGEEINDGLFPSIDGSEFEVWVEDGILKFTYDQGEGDPFLHFFSIKQGEEYALFYDELAITMGEIDLAFYFGVADFSHITFFDTGSTAVPEPGTWGMMLMGFGAAGFAMRRRRRGSGLAQVA